MQLHKTTQEKGKERVSNLEKIMLQYNRCLQITTFDTQGKTPSRNVCYMNLSMTCLEWLFCTHTSILYPMKWVIDQKWRVHVSELATTQCLFGESRRISNLPPKRISKQINPKNSPMKPHTWIAFWVCSHLQQNMRSREPLMPKSQGQAKVHVGANFHSKSTRLHQHAYLEKVSHKIQQ